ncbi:MAG: hypothetical protein FJ100_13450 [Deltaproteobacteria bacterium]|nr:hypothetical protein [Deltaproteobacteria bacterium]
MRSSTSARYCSGLGAQAIAVSTVPTADSSDAGADVEPAPDAEPAVAADTDASIDAPSVQDAKKYPDCTLPQAEDCPCTAAELGKMSCLKITDGLVCNKPYFDGVLVWQHVSDCCRDPDPACNKSNPKPTPPWCNGKYPYCTSRRTLAAFRPLHQALTQPPRGFRVRL